MSDTRSNELIVADAIRAAEIYEDMPPADVAAEVVAALVATGRLTADGHDTDQDPSVSRIRCAVCGAEIALGGARDSGQIRPWVEYPGWPPADDHEHAPAVGGRHD